MDYRQLGNTQLHVSRLCFGGLSISPLQACLKPEIGGELIAYGVEKGINFLDTAELYGLYPTLREAYRLIKRDQLILATKSYAYSKETAVRSVETALETMQIDYIDVFMLHEQESEHTLRGHQEALDQLMIYKEQGIVKHIGLSTHYIAGVMGGIKHPAIEVIHPIYNAKGIGIVDGNADEMLSAILSAKKAQKGVYAMKILGGGHLIASAQDEILSALKLSAFDAIAIGMKSKAEIDVNAALFSGESVDSEKLNALKHDRHLLIHDWCTACGACVDKCAQNALKLSEGHAMVTHEKCVLCGYCAAVCPEFCIKVI